MEQATDKRKSGGAPMAGAAAWHPGLWHGVVRTPGGEWWEHRPPLSVIEPGTYTIRVQGHLDSIWSDQLGGMRITVSGTGRRAVTVLFGHHVDQAAFLGVLNAL
jgi:hypothetical protein